MNFMKNGINKEHIIDRIKTVKNHFEEEAKEFDKIILNIIIMRFIAVTKNKYWKTKQFSSRLKVVMCHTNQIISEIINTID